MKFPCSRHARVQDNQLPRICSEMPLGQARNVLMQQAIRLVVQQQSLPVNNSRSTALWIVGFYCLTTQPSRLSVGRRFDAMRAVSRGNLGSSSGLRVPLSHCTTAVRQATRQWGPDRLLFFSAVLSLTYASMAGRGKIDTGTAGEEEREKETNYPFPLTLTLTLSPCAPVPCSRIVLPGFLDYVGIVQQHQCNSNGTWHMPFITANDSLTLRHPSPRRCHFSLP